MDMILSVSILYKLSSSKMNEKLRKRYTYTNIILYL